MRFVFTLFVRPYECLYFILRLIQKWCNPMSFYFSFTHNCQSFIDWNLLESIWWPFSILKLIIDHENIWIYCYMRSSIHEKYIKSNQKYVLVASSCQKSINWSKMIRVLSCSFWRIKIRIISAIWAEWILRWVDWMYVSSKHVGAKVRNILYS